MEIYIYMRGGERTYAPQLADECILFRLQPSNDAMSQASAEGVLIVLTHSVDTSVLIFQGERPVTQLYCGKIA